MNKTDGSENVILNGMVRWYAMSRPQCLFPDRLSDRESRVLSPVDLRRRAARCVRIYSAFVSGRQKKRMRKVMPERMRVS